jgi:hypothetical protein
MRALTFAAVGAALGLIIAAVLGAGQIVIYRHAAAFTSSALFAMGNRTLDLLPQFLVAGIILGLVGSTIKPRDPEAEAINRLLVKGLAWQIAIPVFAFLFLYIISRDSLTSMAFFLFAMLGSVTSFITRTHHHRSHTVHEGDLPPAEIEGDPATLIWHPAWSGRQPETI